MRLSVIIPHYNRSVQAERTLDGLADQTLDRDVFEVVVVDDGSREEERRRLRTYRAPFALTIVEKENGGLASARNRGAAQARGEVLLFLDDDVLPERDLLRQHLASHDAHDGPCAVVGALPYPPGTRMTPFLWYLERSGHYDLYIHEDKYDEGKPPMPPMNGNSSVSRRTFESIGGYDEGFRRYGSEDLDLGYRLEQAGVPFVYNPEAIGYHDHLKSFVQFQTDMETSGESLIQLYRKHPAIRESKKIDIVEDSWSTLPSGKRLTKLVMETTMAAPWIMTPARWVIALTERFYAARRFLFPLYRVISYHHYAVGMRRGLARGARP